MWPWLLLAAGLLFLASLAYWQLILAEGAHLGPRVVVFLYDLAARRYDRIKGYEPGLEDATLGRPLAQCLGSGAGVIVLDVATGTGRLPMSLLRQPDFHGRVIGLDLSGGMLAQAAHNLAAHGDRVLLLQHDARRLPFDDGVFDAVTMIEALEFVPSSDQVLQELLRVLKPGGTLVFTNRVGLEAWFLLGRAFSRARLERAMTALPLEAKRVMRWEENYDLVWARRTGQH